MTDERLRELLDQVRRCLECGSCDGAAIAKEDATDALETALLWRDERDALCEAIGAHKTVTIGGAVTGETPFYDHAQSLALAHGLLQRCENAERAETAQEDLRIAAEAATRAVRRECDEAHASERAAREENDALKAALREYAPKCNMPGHDRAGNPFATQRNVHFTHLRACDVCAKASVAVTFSDLPHAAAIRALTVPT